MKTAKEVTINYLGSIKKDRENAIEKSNCRRDMELEFDVIFLDTAIGIVEESEGE